jgi:NADH-quinone oxidoreductase subunit N
MATLIKAGVLLAVLRLFGTATISSPLVDLLAVLPLVSIVWGNLRGDAADEPSAA